METNTDGNFSSMGINSHVDLQKEWVRLCNWLKCSKRTNRKIMFDVLAGINNNLQSKQNVITAPLHETIQHLNTEIEDKKNEAETNAEYYKKDVIML